MPALAARLRATPAELAGLAVLLAGVVAVAVVLSRPSGDAPPGDGAVAGSSVTVGAPAGSVLAPAGGPAELTVHVTGAVTTPGVLMLPAGARVADAVRAAGGLTRDADPGGLNLARLVSDGEQIVVPVVALPGSGSGGGPPAGGGGGATTADGRIDLNRATAGELEELPGVGPVLAERIVAYRDEHGPFTEVGQLREVSGIGERTFQSLAELVAVG
ncbi:MAG: ComEA family DNA-binding protein [Actinobacteria bacterium]|nr:ComEA family DNA-binding protein [Actinomycetota bacterium]